MNELERLCKDFLNKVGSLTPTHTTNKKKNPHEFKHLLYEVEINEKDYDWERINLAILSFYSLREFIHWSKDKGLYVNFNNQRFVLEDLGVKKMEGRNGEYVYTYRFQFVEI